MFKSLSSGVQSEQPVYQRILEAHSGRDYQAVYMPEVYCGITLYLLSKWGLIKYQESGDIIEETIKAVCQTNCTIESDTLSQDQVCRSILFVVDYTLGITNTARCFSNRLKCGQALFPEQHEIFSSWLTDYREESPEVIIEIQHYMIGLSDEIAGDFCQINSNVPMKYFELPIPRGPKYTKV